MDLQNEPAMKAKSEFRRLVKGLPIPPRLDAGLWLEHFRKLSVKSAVLVGYMPLADEPDCREILEYWLKESGSIYLPVFDAGTRSYELALVKGLDSGSLCIGHYGIAEPLPALPRMAGPYCFEGGCVWLVPGIAFSRQGVRLGRGAGYYDRLLAGSNGVKVGLSYEDRVFDWLPSEEHDVKMDYLLTEMGLAEVN